MRLHEYEISNQDIHNELFKPSNFLSASKKQLPVLEKLILPPGHQVGRASILSTDQFSTIVDLKGVPKKGVF